MLIVPYELLFLLLRILSDGKVHTYKALAAKINRTVPDLLKLINHLTDHGIEINKINDTSVCLKRTFKWLSEKKFILYFNQKFDLFNLIKFNLLDSTNSYLARNKAFYLKQNSIPVVTTELQTKGRGTSDRGWHSNLGGSLTFSFLWQFKQNLRQLPALTLVLGVGIVRVLRRLSLTDISLKWPNDIICHNRKIAGILTESSLHANNSLTAIIGIGINLQLTSITTSKIDNAVTDLFKISGKQFDRNELLATLLIELRSILITFQTEGFSIFRQEWESYHAFHGKKVVLYLPDNSTTEGIVDGVQDNGALLLTMASGKKSFNVGEIRLMSK